MSKLVIVVPADRRRCGRAVLLGGDGKTRLAPFRVLATASASVATRYGNVDRDWRRPFGHSPTGTYVVGGSLPPGVMPKPSKRSRRFGEFGALILVPTGGKALEAARAGRARFLLHGGVADSRGRLRPTFGGFRVSDGDLRVLLAAVNDAFDDSDPVSAVEVAETSAPSWLDEGRLDESGRLRPAVEGPTDVAARARRVTGSMSVTRAALLALGFGVLGRRAKRTRAGELGAVDRRDFVGLAFLAIGSLGSAGCSHADNPVPDHACAENRSPAHPTVGDAGIDGDDGGGPDGGYDGGNAGDGAGGAPGRSGAAPGDGCAPNNGTGYGDTYVGDTYIGDTYVGDTYGGTTGDTATGDTATGDTGDSTGGG